MKRQYFLFCILILTTSLAFGDYLDKIAKLARECQAGKAKSCEKLAKMATEEKDSAMRKAATEKLSDQALLAKIARMDQQMDVRLAAVKSLTDQATLAEIAKNDSSPNVRSATILNLTDQALLAEVAKTASDPDVCKAAVGNLSDQTLLADIAKKANQGAVQLTAVRRLADQALLAEVAKTASNPDVGIAAVEDLSDQAVLADLAKAASNSDVGIAAVEKLTDQPVLAEIARAAADWRVRRASVEKLTDQPTLAEIARKDSQREVWHSAMKKLTDQVLLGEMAKTDARAATRAAAAMKLTDPAILAEIARKDSSWYMRSAAARKLTDQPTLAEIARKDSDPNVRSTAVWKLTDQALLAEIAKKDRDSYVREAAMERLKLGSLPEIGKIVAEIEVIEKLELQGESRQFTLTAGDLKQLLAFVVTPQMDGFFDNNRLILIDQDGNLFKYVAVAPISQQDTAWIARGGPLPLDKHDVTVTFKNGSFTTDFKPSQGDARVIWSGGEARFRILFEIAKDSPILSLRFGLLPPVSLVVEDQASQTFAINDRKFIDTSLPDPTSTDVMITGANENGFACSGKLEIRNGKYMLFANGAKHTWIGTIGAFGYVFSSDANQPLTFRVDKTNGYTYVKGIGTIKFPDGRTVVLTQKKSSS